LREGLHKPHEGGLSWQGPLAGLEFSF
jgi:hypothetical protein